MPTTAHDVSVLFIELGLAVIGLALIARLASRWGFSAIPLYLLAGLAFGNGGLAPLSLSRNFIHIGAEIGVLLLLFMLGVEYSPEQLKTDLRANLPAGIADLLLNLTPGLVAGLLLGWKLLAAVLLGGVTYISSSGIIAKVLADLNRLGNRETPTVLSVLVLEDLAMAVYLPLVGVLIAGGGPAKLALSIAIAVAAVIVVLFIALQYGQRLSSFAAHQSDEIVLLTTFGTVLLVAGVAQYFQVSAAIGAFLVGIAVSGPIAEQSRRLLAPLRDLFAATFFFFFGLQIDPAALPSALPVAIVLGMTTGVTKLFTGYWAADHAGADQRGKWRAGGTLIARGEFSIIIAGLGVGIEPRLAPLAAAYVLLMALSGPILARFIK
jgi:monovalent cation:H+ antiporter-2, CPA2 family